MEEFRINFRPTEGPTISRTENTNNSTSFQFVPNASEKQIVYRVEALEDNELESENHQDSAATAFDGLLQKPQSATIDILQSECDENVFSVDTNTLMNQYSLNCPSYVIEDGDVVPVQKRLNKPTARFRNKNLNSSNHIAARKAQPQSQSKEHNMVLHESKSTSTENANISFTSADFVDIIKTVDTHSKQISKIFQTLSSQNSKNMACNREIKIQRMIHELRSLLPPTLHSVVSRHLTGKATYTDSEKLTFSALYRHSPNGYRYLIEKFQWKLPPTHILEKLLLGEF